MCLIDRRKNYVGLLDNCLLDNCQIFSPTKYTERENPIEFENVQKKNLTTFDNCLIHEFREYEKLKQTEVSIRQIV